MYASLVPFSYIDPVSGVILLQLAIGGCIGCVAGFRQRIWRLVSRRFSGPVVREEAEIAGPETARSSPEGGKAPLPAATIAEAEQPETGAQTQESRVAA